MILFIYWHWIYWDRNILIKVLLRNKRLIIASAVPRYRRSQNMSTFYGSVSCNATLAAFSEASYPPQGKLLWKDLWKPLCNNRMPGKKSRKVGGKEEEEMIATLQKKTSLSATEIKEQYQEFKKMCPQGQVNNQWTLSLHGDLLCFPRWQRNNFWRTQPSFLATRGLSWQSVFSSYHQHPFDQWSPQYGTANIIFAILYRVFDDDQSGTMDFEEFVLATNCTSLSDPLAKVRWHVSLWRRQFWLKCSLLIWYFPHSWIFDVFDEDGGGTIELDEVIKLVGENNLKKNIGIIH